MIPLCINGKDYYDREEALAAWFEEWLMKQDFEQDLIDRELELEYRKTHPDWNTPYVMYGVFVKNISVSKRMKLPCFMTCYRDKSVLVLLKHIGIKYCTRERPLLKKLSHSRLGNIPVDIWCIPCLLRRK